MKKRVVEKKKIQKKKTAKKAAAAPKPKTPAKKSRPAAKAATAAKKPPARAKIENKKTAKPAAKITEKAGAKASQTENTATPEHILSIRRKLNKEIFLKCLEKHYLANEDFDF